MHILIENSSRREKTGMNILNFPISCALALRKLPNPVIVNAVRHGHRLRGKRPGIARSITDRLAEEYAVDEELVKPVDIGFPALRRTRAEQIAIKAEHFKQQKSNENLERLARTKQLEVNVDEVYTDWLKTEGQGQIKTVATHYGIYEHLFGYAYFLPRIPLDIKFEVDEDTLAPVYFGNTLKPKHAQKAPTVSFDSTIKLLNSSENTENTLWTLVLTNPDGHLKDSEKEYVHWFIGNIPNGDVSKGEVIVPYLQPFPPRGTGFHRHVFVLYKQDQKLNFDELKVNQSNDLDGRTFKTLDFYRKHQDIITPAGLAFFQSDWDATVKDVFHKVLDIKEPIFEYDFPGPYKRDEMFFPLKHAFNLYLDRYRDQKQINKEFLERKLKKTHPFEGPEPPLRFPNAHPLKNIPSWLITEKKKARQGWGQINEIQ